MKTNILITGATGNTGMPVGDRLSQMKVPFRAMVHSPDKEHLVKKGFAEVVVGDFHDTASLERALAGIDRVYLLTPPSLEQVKLQTAFVDVAKRTGVKHIVKLSALGTALDSPVGLMRAHAQTEEYIRASGIPYTFVQPHFFMENLLMNSATVHQDGAIYSPLGEARISPVSVQDIGAVVAEILTSNGHAGKVYTLTGPAALNYAEIAAALEEAISRPVHYIPVPFEAAKQGMVSSGMPDWLAEDLIRLMKSWRDGKGSMVTPDVEMIINRKPMAIRDFFENCKDLFIEKSGKAA